MRPLLVLAAMVLYFPVTVAAEALQIGVTDTRQYGRNYGNDLAIEKHTATFAAAGEGVSLDVDGYDINAHYEVDVLLNGKLLGKLTPGAAAALTPSRFYIPASEQLATNLLEFVHNSPDNIVWGVTNLLLQRARPARILVNQRLDQALGWYFGNDGHSHAAYFEFTLPPGNTQDVGFSAQGFDIDWEGEVSLFVNGEFVGYLAPTPDNDLGPSRLTLPANILQSSNVIKIQSSGWSWGIKDLLLSAAIESGGEPGELLTDDGEYGRNFGTNQHPLEYNVTFDGDDADVILSVDGYDINAHYEVEVDLNGKPLGNLTPGVAFGFGASEFFIPKSRLKATNTVTFTHNSDNVTWGVTRIRVVTGSPPSLPTNTIDVNAYGWQFGSSRHHRHLYFDFELPDTITAPVHFTADGGEISWSQEVAVFVNGTQVGYLASGEGGAAATDIELPIALLRQRNRLELRASGFAWGVTNLRVVSGEPRDDGENTAPALTPVPSRQDFINALVDFTVTASDPDAGEQLRFEMQSAPPGVFIDAASGRVTGRPGRLGQYATKIVVRDAAGAQDITNFTWTVQDPGPNSPPVISLVPNREELAGVDVRITVQASDSDADRFSFTVAGQPPGIAIDKMTGTLSGSPAVAGEYVTVLTAVDVRGAQSSTAFTWNVLANPLLGVSHPVASLIPGQTDTGTYGYLFGDQQRWRSTRFEFPRQDGDIEIRMRGFDLDVHNELAVTLNGAVLGFLPRGVNDALTREIAFLIPEDEQQFNNTVTVTSQMPGDIWGVTDIALNLRRTGPPSPDEVSHVVNSGDDLAQRVQSGSPGDVFVLRPGIHRLTETVFPKPSQRFFCEQGAIVSGAVALTGQWTATGASHRLGGAPLFKPGNGAMQAGADINQGLNDLFIGNRAYLRVDSLDKVNDRSRVVNGETLYAGTFFQDGDEIHVASNPGSALVEMSDTRFAFQQWDGLGDDVTIENCIIEKFAVNDLEGAVDAKYTKRWYLKNVTGRYNHTAAVRVGRSTSIVGGRYVNNGQPAITGQLVGDGGSQFGYADNVLIDGVEVAYNTWIPFNIFWHSGGIKLFRAQGVIVRDSQIHHNDGPGVWTDIDVLNTYIENNSIYNNTSNGVKLEATYFGAVKDNDIVCNSTLPDHNLGTSWFWGASVYLQNSQGFTVSGNNIIVDLGDGIGLVDNQDRGSFAPYGRRESINNSVTDNDITFSSRARPAAEDGITGIETDFGASAAGLNASIAAANNTMNRNHYVLSDANKKHWKFFNFFYPFQEVDPDLAEIYPPEFAGAPWDVLYERDATFTVRPAAALAPRALCP